MPKTEEKQPTQGDLGVELTSEVDLMGQCPLSYVIKHNTVPFLSD